MQVLTTTLGCVKKENDLSLLDFQTLVKHNIVVSDIDNTLLDLLGGIEDNIKGYSRDMQTTYSFFNSKIDESLDPNDIIDLFSKKGFFSSLKPTKLLNMLKTKDTYIGNLLIITNEPSTDAFLEKVNLLSELMPNFEGTRVAMYGHKHKGIELATRNDILKSVKSNKSMLLEDNPDSLTYAYLNGINTLTLDHKYVLNHLDMLDKTYSRYKNSSNIRVIKNK